MKTQEEKRIAIAEADGIININSKCWRGHKNGFEIRIHDWFNDLNACHEMVQGLTDDQRNRFRGILTYIWCANYNNTHGAFPKSNDVCNATAAQRCEAFGKTLNLW